MMQSSTLVTTYDPHAFYEQKTRTLSLREHELRVLREEFSFLQTCCGGVSDDDVARYRASVLKHSVSTPVPSEEVVVIKDEPQEEEATLQGGGLVSLKSVLLGLGCNPQSINTSCRRVKALLVRSKIPIFCRHGATHVRVSDCMRIKSVIGFCSSE